VQVINQLRRRVHPPTVLHSRVQFARGSTRLEAPAPGQLTSLVERVPVGVNPVTTVTAIARHAGLNPQPRLTAMLRAWKVSSYLRDCGLGGTVVTSTTPGRDHPGSLGSVMVTIEYLE